MTHVLVTGAGGYVGGRLLKSLEAGSHEVSALVRVPTPRIGSNQIVLDLAEADSDALDAACRRVDTIVHLAGENEVVAAQAPAAALASTVVASERLAEAAVRQGVGRVIYMSTVHVYGARMLAGATLTEDLRCEPRATYAISRLASEHAATALAKDSFELLVFRLTNSVGAPDHPSVDRWTLVTNDLCRQAALTNRLELRTSGAQWRDFVALGDVCAVIGASIEKGDGSVPAGTYNLGSGKSATVRSVAEEVQDAFERLTGERPQLVAPELEPEGERPQPYFVSVDRLGSAGINTLTPIRQAIEETAAFCLENKEDLR